MSKDLEEKEEEIEEPCGDCGKIDTWFDECEYCHKKLCAECNEMHYCDKMPDEIRDSIECEECIICNKVDVYTEMTKNENKESICDECILQLTDKGCQTMSKIESFDGENRFLSNFWPAVVWFENEQYRSVEYAYVAAKTKDLEIRRQVRECPTSGQAKRLGRKIKLREDWEEVKISIMEDLVWQKFSKNKELGQKLLDTGDAELIEGNWWHDVYWGVCNGIGQNKLGIILMDVRNKLRNV